MLNIIKIRLLRMLNNGILTISSIEKRNEIRLFNAISYMVFLLVSFFSIVFFIYGFMHHVLVMSVIQFAIVLNYFLLRKGFVLTSIFVGVESLIIALFFSIQFYPQSKSLIFIYLIIVSNLPLIFKLSNIRLVLFFIFEALFLFYLQLLYKEYLPDLSVRNVNFAIHSNISTVMLIICFIVLLLFHIKYILHQEIKLNNERVKLIQVQNKLKYQNEELQKFGLAITHSLKTPLVIISGLLNKIKRNLLENVGYNPLYFKVIKESNTLIHKYSEDLTFYSSVVNIEKQYCSFDVSKIIDKQRKILMNRFDNAEITNNVSSLIIRKNLLLFEIIIQVLLENAILYNASSTPLVTINSFENEENLDLFIKDNGIGIGDDYKDNIFQPFVRINKKYDIKGSGLGLTCAKVACNKIGAKIELIESNNEGSVFLLRINKKSHDI